MARYEHLPIYKAMDLTVYLEKIVRNFSRYHKYTHVGTRITCRLTWLPVYQRAWRFSCLAVRSQRAAAACAASSSPNAAR